MCDALLARSPFPLRGSRSRVSHIPPLGSARQLITRSSRTKAFRSALSLVINRSFSPFLPSLSSLPLLPPVSRFGGCVLLISPHRSSRRSLKPLFHRAEMWSPTSSSSSSPITPPRLLARRATTMFNRVRDVDTSFIEVWTIFLSMGLGCCRGKRAADFPRNLSLLGRTQAGQ